jgi:stage III sporulation protein AG
MDVFKTVKALLDGKNRKKLIENTVIVIIIGIIIIIAGGTLFKGGSANTARKDSASKTKQDITQGGTTASSGDELETRLGELLLQMKGVGRVDVMVTYSASKQNVPAYDVKKNTSKTQEKDSGGGTRSISSEEYDSALAYEDSAGGGKQPVILKKLEPEVKGVLIVAEGAGDTVVREQIVSAVTVLLDIPAHKVQVVPRKK